ncbi:SixA phosphatase family protein [Magnetospirillum fulvum]|uniref:Phosphohistidine phosphatase n=1 Tax=Magnetospirillum fulvum TaxID=1082 RepID=A0A1H6GTA8_MAGFU|nr:histidine phosphatase family protein [Magnetospirillum fulvum]SEH25114.1 phosphohistidine phosphatase [Magnetospirillum fulvum]
MRKLFLLRHAKSSWDDPVLTDFDRPLSRRGRDAAARIAAFIERIGLTPNLALVSTARRTRETWDVLAETIPAIPTSFEPCLYAAGQSDLLRRLQKLDPPLESVIVVGHNPGLERLADFLGGGQGEPVALDRMARKYPTGALAELTLDVPGWDQLQCGCGRITRFTRPVDLDGEEDDD